MARITWQSCRLHRWLLRRDNVRMESPKMTDQLITGTDVIRKALHAKNVKFNLSGLAKTCNVPTDTLEQFIAGRVTLLPNMLQTLTTELFAGNAIYDEKIDRLRPARQQEPTSMGTKPPPIDPKMLKSFKAGPAAAAPRPVVPVKPLTKTTLPGWAE